MINNIHCICSDTNLKTRLSRLKNESVSGSVYFYQGFDELSDFSSNDFLILGSEDFFQVNIAELEPKGITSERMIIVSNYSVDQNINKIFSKYPLSYLLSDESNLVDQIQEIFVLQNSNGTLLPFLRDKLEEVSTFELKDTGNLNEVINEIVQEGLFDEYFKNLRNIVRLILSEALSNSFFHSPEGKNQNTDGKRNRVHLENNFIKLGFYETQQQLVFIIQDPFGNLTKDVIEKSMHQVVYNKENQELGFEGGMGLYFLYSYAHEVIINIVKSSLTEVIIKIDKSKRFKEYEVKKRSYSHYEKDGE
jgi:hypothetical protein